MANEKAVFVVRVRRVTGTKLFNDLESTFISDEPGE
jgi:hypothetical protein